MIDQYSGLLQSAQYNYKTGRVEVKSHWDDDRLWTTTSSTTAQVDQTSTYYRGVAWLNRAIELRSNAVADMPFAIMRGDTEIDNSAEWANKIGIMPNPHRLLWLVEAALCFGPAYLWREKNRVAQLPLRYIVASTIEPKIDEDLGLTHFVRTLGTKQKDVAKDTLIYFWKPDPYVELGPAQNPPIAAALSAAGVLYNLNQFAASFWARGAIKATMLTVEGNPSPEAKNDLKRWWERAVAGINNAFASNVVSASVKPVVVGEGLESLQNTALTSQQREDISTALGIPQTLLFSTGAGGLGGGGVVEQDDVHFYSKTIVPECDFIQSVLNEQLFDPMGLHFEFRPETLDVFQQDEQQRAGAFRAYVDAGLPIEVSGLMLGLELPEGWTWERIGAEKEAKREAMAEQLAGKPDDDEDDEKPTLPPPPMATASEPKAMLDDLRKWRVKSQKRGKLADFESDAIPAHVVTAVKLVGFDWLTNLHELKAVEPDRAAEEALRRAIAKLLMEQRAKIAQAIMDSEAIDWAEIEREFNRVLTPTLAKIATDQAIAMAFDMGVGFDPALVNVAAWKWATAYSYELVKGITTTTQTLVANATAQFVATPGMTIGELASMLESAFGPMRAQMIAVTETTRAYSQATTITQAMLKEMGVTVVRVWQTSADEKVCEICGPLDGKTEDEWDDPDGPPAHVNCRCWTTTKVVR